VLVKSYRDLLVWQKAVDLVTCCYALTKQFPKSETPVRGSEPDARGADEETTATNAAKLTTLQLTPKT
jgi:hypothetical protein